jgi:hypothetical protein
MLVEAASRYGFTSLRETGIASLVAFKTLISFFFFFLGSGWVEDSLVEQVKDWEQK